MDANKKTAVVIPFYKTQLSDYERISLNQCLKVLGNHPIIAIKPDSIAEKEINQLSSFKIIKSFESSYFDNIAGYNRLMLAPEFYECFLEYEFILIYQLDAYVFRDELTLWSSKGFDYVGAPWIRDIDDSDIFKTIKTKFQTFIHKRNNVYVNGLPSAKQFENQVGNGGFSLRRVQKFYDLSKKFSEKIKEYHSRTEHQFHEDAFWSIEVNRKEKHLNIPGYKVALGFAFENSPDRAFRLANNHLPFGCHAWDEKLEFWRPYIGSELSNSI